MLLLYRRVGESIIISDNITITFLESKRNQVRIGIDAPKEITVHREEVHEHIQQQRFVKKSPTLVMLRRTVSSG